MHLKVIAQESFLHQTLKRISRLIPDKLKMDEDNLEVLVNSPIACLNNFACYTYKPTPNWFALQATILEWLRADGAIVEIESIPGDGWWTKITAIVGDGKVVDRIETFNNECPVQGLAQAYEQYLSLRTVQEEARSGG